MLAALVDGQSRVDRGYFLLQIVESSLVLGFQKIPSQIDSGVAIEKGIPKIVCAKRRQFDIGSWSLK